MAYELDSQMMQRLAEHYRGLSDGELLELAARPDELTEVAHQALRGEMTSRHLKADAAELDVFSPGHSDGVPESRLEKKPADGAVALTTFYDAIAAGEACDHLEAAGLEVDVRDISQAVSGGGSFYGGPPVALQLLVQGRDREPAMKVLRQKMGLFPLQEVEVADEVVDDGTVATVGDFGSREDAEAVVQALEEAHIWHRLVANPDGSAETEDAYRVEVLEVDLVRAGEWVEKALGFE